MSWKISPLATIMITKGYCVSKEDGDNTTISVLSPRVTKANRTNCTGLISDISSRRVSYQQQHGREWCLSTDVDHRKQDRPVAFSGPNKQHPGV